MNRPSPATRSRLAMVAVTGLLVLGTAACSFSAATSGAVSTSQKLSQQGYAVSGLESRPNDNLLANVTVFSGESLDAVVSTTASIVWRGMPVRIASLDVDAHGAGAEVAKHFTRAELEQTYGTRPAGLDRDVSAVAADVATDAINVGALALAGLALALMGLASVAILVIVIQRRRRTTNQLQNSQPGTVYSPR